MKNRTHHLNVNISVSSVRGAFAPLRAFIYYLKLTYNPPRINNRLKYIPSPTPQRTPEVAHRAPSPCGTWENAFTPSLTSNTRYTSWNPTSGTFQGMRCSTLFHTETGSRCVTCCGTALPNSGTRRHKHYLGKISSPSYLAHRKTVGCRPRFSSFHISSLTVGI